MDLQSFAALAQSAVIGGAVGALVTAMFSRRTMRISFPDDLAENLQRVRREWAAFEEDATHILEETEAKRAKIQLERARAERAQRSNSIEPEAPAPPASPQDERDAIKQARRAGGVGSRWNH